MFHRPYGDRELGNNHTMSVTTSLLTACSGFLSLCCGWTSSSMLRSSRTGIPAVNCLNPVLDSIAGYYRRAVTGSRPMSHLIAVVMVVLLGALGFRATRGHDPGWLVAVSILLAGVPILLAATHTVPNAVRLGSRSGSRTDKPPWHGPSVVIIWSARSAYWPFWSCGWSTRRVRNGPQDALRPGGHNGDDPY